MRVALLTEGGYPYAQGESVAWCDRLLHGLAGHGLGIRFDIGALSRSRQQAGGPRRPLPSTVRRVCTAPLWGPPADGRLVSAALGRRFGECFAELTAALSPGPRPPGEEEGGRPGDRFAAGLYGLAALAAEHGGLGAWLCSEHAVRVLEAACRADGVPRAVRAARMPDLLAVAGRLERALRPLSLDWYGPDGPASAGLCHAVGAGPAVLPGLLARHFRGTPLLVTEYDARLGEHHGAAVAVPAPAVGAAHTLAPSAPGAPVRALLAAFQTRLAHEAYARAELVTPGDTLARRWLARRGADREAAGAGAPAALVWAGRAEPGAGLTDLLHAFHRVRAAEPAARLRIAAVPPGGGRGDAAYLGRCRALAARLFPGAPDAVAFTAPGGPAAAFAAGRDDVVVRPGAAAGFPVPLVEAMLRARATVSADAGAVRAIVGGAGLVVPPRDPGALAAACLPLLRDPGRRARLGAGARARALELFTVERNVAVFRAVYSELLAGAGHASRAVRGPGAKEPTGAAPAATAVTAGRGEPT
ncbi:DUF3492 domain-containing protein [Streptomyces sp. NBC_01803]|uniref:DUF3492 domain-containing protein n=1 Tax=Streptomyces sp. NBC_01803 TaxID=2975946 RepID=UPI002DD84A30|nr:DUF3492 domain-containing protein [Streptomyces sp. NBC_01803]WSA46038.1 DUF3492 domain-containing protein [Streptomyces sp. NBC_01803]